MLNVIVFPSRRRQTPPRSKPGRSELFDVFYEAGLTGGFSLEWVLDHFEKHERIS